MKYTQDILYKFFYMYCDAKNKNGFAKELKKDYSIPIQESELIWDSFDMAVGETTFYFENLELDEELSKLSSDVLH